MLNVNLRHDKRAMKTTNDDDKHTKDGLLLGRRKMFGLKCFMCPHNASIDSHFVFSLFPLCLNGGTLRVRAVVVVALHVWIFDIIMSPYRVWRLNSFHRINLCILSSHVEDIWYAFSWALLYRCVVWNISDDSMELICLFFGTLRYFFYHFCVQMQISHDLWSKH